MQDHPLDHSGAVAPGSIDHLDLVTAELRRRIAGIGLAIAELREETGRLRASADGRYHAVALLDRPHGGDMPTDAVAAPTPSVTDQSVPAASLQAAPVVQAAPVAQAAAVVAVSAPAIQPAIQVESGPAEPVSPWGDVPSVHPDPVVRHESASSPGVAEVDPVQDAAESSVVEPVLTWVPESAPIGGGDTAAVAAAEEPSFWTDAGDDDAAAFEAFFSAEIEPEPSQRWLLSD